ncbi:BTB/POZ domain-containing protein At4g08455 [Prosopis cineraria]|uniref:BTB/POZ domain-containing protein At4g08455 n=1 Tax=Prosopis cineraria TaxID=364024 RepID=UPI0024101D93|nr:BTB/POZ domain-containing protein At4g08455 [Prosopis cineraria]
MSLFEEMQETDGENSMYCLSCQDYYVPGDAGTCRECYEEANETEEELKTEIDDLKAKVAFLSLLPPIDHHNRSDSDVILVPSDETSDLPSLTVPAHKVVLVSRSPVFRAMLENDMEERRSGTIKISDVSYNALRAFVDYLYTAEACLDDQMACELLVLAEKYQVKHLKAYCEKYLMARLNWEKAVANYAFAHRHNAKQLLDASLGLITDNMDKLSKREEYEDLVESNPRIVVEIYEAYLSKQVNTAASKKSFKKK